MGATYDLSSLMYPNGFVVEDGRNDGSVSNAAQYMYQFSLCENVSPLPQSPYCNTTMDDDGTNPMTGPSPAFQYLKNLNPGANYQQCWRLGDSYPATTQNNVQWSLLWGPMTTNPAQGVSIAYLNGNRCRSANGTELRRSITLHFECEPARGVFSFNTTVLELTDCEYHVVIRSKYGCPVQCPIATPPNSYISGICAGHGVCDYDSTNGYAKCFCNEGWSGQDCTQLGDAGLPPKSSHAGPIAGGFFGGLFGGLLIGAAIYYYFVVVRGEGGAGGAGSGSAAWANFNAEPKTINAGAAGYVAPDHLSALDDQPAL